MWNFIDDIQILTLRDSKRIDKLKSNLIENKFDMSKVNYNIDDKKNIYFVKKSNDQN